MTKDWKINKGILKIPVEKGVNYSCIKIYTDGKLMFDGYVPISESRVDFWGIIPMEMPGETLLSVECPTENNWYQGIQWEEGGQIPCSQRPVFHITPPSGSFTKIKGITKDPGGWNADYTYDPFGMDKNRNVQNHSNEGYPVLSIGEGREKFFFGDIEEEYLFENNTICMAKSLNFQWGQNPFFNLFTPPLYINENEDGEKYLSGGKEIERLRIWKREWEDINNISSFTEALRFRIKPGVWPNIELIPPEGKTDDVTAKAFEIRLEAIPEKNAILEMEFCGFKVCYDNGVGILKSGGYQIPTPMDRLRLTVYVDVGCVEFICGGRAIFCINRTMEETRKSVDNSVSGNLGKCQIDESSMPGIKLLCKTGTFSICHLEVYGLKKKENTDNYLERFGIDKEADPVFYEGKSFKVFNHRVRDRNYGYPDAVAVNDRMVVSPIRVVEEFDWRKTPWGDMVRVVNRRSIWYGQASLDQYPRLDSPVTSLNASYNIAVDIFEQCKNKKFALNGQAGLWSAGLFQGPGEGFGVWLRDSVHVALRCGSLIDPLGSGKTLRFAMEKGFDNGSDGPAMGAVGLWDYYLVTGNTDILYEMWPLLVLSMKEADRRYDYQKGLVNAEKSTSNDAFPEPENGGYSLSTECYFMKAYESMVSIANVIGFGDKLEVEGWAGKCQRLRLSIQEKYWNSQYGYFTSGPSGSDAFTQGIWETSGEESVLWPKFGIASKKQQKSILERLESVAMTDYGIELFPFREEKNHFCGSVWGVWQSGFSSAASQLGNTELIKKLLAQQIRVCLMNKTFYEVIDSETGTAWRWPGQLWNAAGFISLIFYGVFGMEYNEKGMLFHPAVPKQLENIRLKALPYRKMFLDIYICGWGCRLDFMEIDGQRSSYVDIALTGHHQVVLHVS